MNTRTACGRYHAQFFTKNFLSSLDIMNHNVLPMLWQCGDYFRSWLCLTLSRVDQRHANLLQLDDSFNLSCPSFLLLPGFSRIFKTTFPPNEGNYKTLPHPTCGVLKTGKTFLLWINQEMGSLLEQWGSEKSYAWLSRPKSKKTQRAEWFTFLGWDPTVLSLSLYTYPFLSVHKKHSYFWIWFVMNC